MQYSESCRLALSVRSAQLQLKLLVTADYSATQKSKNIELSAQTGGGVLIVPVVIAIRCKHKRKKYKIERELISGFKTRKSCEIA
jgi:hypothetical protein